MGPDCIGRLVVLCGPAPSLWFSSSSVPLVLIFIESKLGPLHLPNGHDVANKMRYHRFDWTLGARRCVWMTLPSTHDVCSSNDYLLRPTDKSKTDERERDGRPRNDVLLPNFGIFYFSLFLAAAQSRMTIILLGVESRQSGPSCALITFVQLSATKDCRLNEKAPKEKKRKYVLVL